MPRRQFSDGTTYKQTDSLVIDSPLAPLLANWFVSKINTQLLEKDLNCKPKFFRWYVDDIFAVCSSTGDRCEFFKKLKQAHSNLIFTMDINNLC